MNTTQQKQERQTPTLSNLVCTECNHMMSITRIEFNSLIVDDIEHVYITCPSCENLLHFVDSVYVETIDDQNHTLTLQGVYGLVSPKQKQPTPSEIQAVEILKNRTWNIINLFDDPSYKTDFTGAPEDIHDVRVYTIFVDDDGVRHTTLNQSGHELIDTVAKFIEEDLEGIVVIGMRETVVIVMS